MDLAASGGIDDDVIGGDLGDRANGSLGAASSSLSLLRRSPAELIPWHFQKSMTTRKLQATCRWRSYSVVTTRGNEEIGDNRLSKREIG